MDTASIFKYEDPVSFLKETFSDKAKANPKFSLRAFAQKLGLSPGSLHKILARQKKLSHERAHIVAKRMGLNAAETEYFSLLIQLHSTKSIDAKEITLARLRKLNPSLQADTAQLSVDQFKTISDWYGLAILELVSFVKTASPWTTARIAKVMGLSLAEVSSSLDRLVNLELLEKSGNVYTSISDSVLITSVATHEAFRNYYRGVLQKSLESLSSQTPQERVTGAEVFAFDATQLGSVKRLTDDYLDALRALAETGESRTELYQAFANVFRLNEKKSTQTQTGEKNEN